MQRMFDPEIWREVTGGAVAERVRRLTRVTPLVPAPGARAPHGRRRLAQAREPAAHGLVQAARRRGPPRGARAASGRRRRPSASSPPRPATTAWASRCAAQAFGVDATVLVSAQTPEVKRAGIAALGAKVEVAGATYDEAEAAARRRAAEADPGLVFVSAFDDDHVIAGNGGLLAREILAQLPDVQAIVVPVGGGGLAGGIGVEVVPRGIKMLGASPEVNCAMRRSLDEGRAYTTYEAARRWPRGWRAP